MIWKAVFVSTNLNLAHRGTTDWSALPLSEVTKTLRRRSASPPEHRKKGHWQSTAIVGEEE